MIGQVPLTAAFAACRVGSGDQSTATFDSDQWDGRARGTDFDSGRTDAEGRARRTYFVMRSRMRTRTVIAERRN